MEIIPFLRTCRLINNLLSDRSFHVYMIAKKSRIRKQNNGLPQGSVLAPLLFNVEMADMPNIGSKKFAYSNDEAIAPKS